MGQHIISIFVFTADEVREVRGGGIFDGIAGDLYDNIRPGGEFAGVAYDDLINGTYTLDTTTHTLTRVAD